jgi:hypothetical protein
MNEWTNEWLTDWFEWKENRGNWEKEKLIYSAKKICFTDIKSPHLKKIKN